MRRFSPTLFPLFRRLVTSRLDEKAPPKILVFAALGVTVIQVCYWLDQYWFRHDTSIASEKSLAAGPVTVLYDCACDGGKPGSGGTGAIFVNGKKVRDRPDPTHDPVSLRN